MEAVADTEREPPAAVLAVPSPDDAPGANESPAAVPAAVKVGEAKTAEAMCSVVARIAAANDLPLEFFWRLIWQESRFNAKAVSHKGAQGIAQFMPGTARWRGLADPFEPDQALHESARWLRELLDEFGNLGLAAAAYNAGPRRVQEWLTGRGQLPGETRAYVRIITSRSAEDWARAGVEQPANQAEGLPCVQLAKLIRPVGVRQPMENRIAYDQAAWAPWGLQLAGAWSEGTVLVAYRILQKKFPAILGDRDPLVLRGRMAGRGSATWYRVRVAEATREGASRLCARLHAAGGACLVFRN